MWFGLLGPLTVHDGAAERPISGAKLRALLAALLLQPNRMVPLDTVEAVLWGEHPPATASASLHNHVARLRRLLTEEGRSRLRAVPGGYLLAVGKGELDSELFADRLDSARAGRLRGDWAMVGRETARALELWRGAPLADLPDLTLAGAEVRPQIQQLLEARIQALEWRFDAELHLGRHRGLAPELARLAEEHPLREAFHRQLMMVLHRTDRQAEALAVFHRLRRTLIDELGIEPGPAIQETHQDILTAHQGVAQASPDRSAPEPGPTESAPTESAPTESAPTESAPTEPGPTEPGSSTAGSSTAGSSESAAAETASGPPRPIPAQLPADTAEFTGRQGAIEELIAMLRPDPALSAPRLVVISGMGGIGKTALAVHAAHRLRTAFPDGQLYADLRGFGAGDARKPHELLARFLTDLGAREEPLPEHTDDRAAQFRSVLHGRRVLLLLDNARNAAQIAPLLPGGGGCAVVVTSRSTLADVPDAGRVLLGPLDMEGQRRLLTALCGSRRVRADPDATAAILAACGGLPLALRIAGARLATRPAWPLTTLAQRLDSSRGRLRALSAGGVAVQDTFAMSYVAMRDSPLPLEAEQARAFRMLGLWSGPVLAAEPAAALLGQPVNRTRDLLEALVDANLLQTPRPGQYTFHDLLAEYAVERAHEEEPRETRKAARLRLLAWYTAAVAKANAVLAPESPPLPPLDTDIAAPLPEFADEEQALHWCARELPALTEAIRLAAGYARPDLAWRMAAGLFGYAQTFWWTREWERCLKAALRCVEKHEDLLGQGWLHSRLGVAHGLAHRSDLCLEHLQTALPYFEKAGDAAGQASLCTNMSVVYRQLGQFGQALAFGERALELHREAGDRERIANVLGNMGDALLAAGDPSGAEARHRQALTLWRERGNLVGTASTLTSLGDALRALDRPEEAFAALDEGLRIRRRLGHHAGTADTLDTLARTHLHCGDRHAAREAWERSLALGRRYGLSLRVERSLRGLRALD
ncbi:AfsR/SARP family transcriptional regulator [Streptomyces sp. NPDC052236]|uniref:AfsR/SARP family transcriptional regulator n=1 Tax=Streptomyces sp. NPDC052236 TaxID=3365686 RepID=UPI0037CF6576